MLWYNLPRKSKHRSLKTPGSKPKRLPYVTCIMMHKLYIILTWVWWRRLTRDMTKQQEDEFSSLLQNNINLISSYRWRNKPHRTNHDRRCRISHVASAHRSAPYTPWLRCQRRSWDIFRCLLKTNDFIENDRLKKCKVDNRNHDRSM